jgi:hypothetical protein
VDEVDDAVPGLQGNLPDGCVGLIVGINERPAHEDVHGVRFTEAVKGIVEGSFAGRDTDPAGQGALVQVEFGHRLWERLKAADEMHGENEQDKGSG